MGSAQQARPTGLGCPGPRLPTWHGAWLLHPCRPGDQPGGAWEPWPGPPPGLCAAVPVRTGCVTVTEGPRAHTPLAKTDTHPRGLFKVWPPQTCSNSITWDLAGVSSPLSPSPREAGGEGGGRPGHLWVNTPSRATDVPNQAGDGLPQARSVSPHPADTGPAAGGRGELGGLPHSSSTKSCIKQRGH